MLWRGPLHVHDLTYANLGAERPEDLQVLCEQCHRWEHFPMCRIEADLDKWLNDFKRDIVLAFAERQAASRPPFSYPCRLATT